MKQKFTSNEFVLKSQLEVKKDFEDWVRISDRVSKRVAAERLKCKNYFSLQLKSTEYEYFIKLNNTLINLTFETETLDTHTEAYLFYDREDKVLSSKNISKIISLLYNPEIKAKLGLEYLFPNLVPCVKPNSLKKMIEGEITNSKQLIKDYISNSTKIQATIPFKKIVSIIQNEDQANIKGFFNAIETSKNPHYLIQKWETLTEKEKELIEDVTSAAFTLGESINPCFLVNGEDKIKKIKDKLNQRLNRITLDQMILKELYPNLSMNLYNTKEIKILSSNFDYFYEAINMNNCLFEKNYFEKAKPRNLFYLSIRYKELKANIEVAYEEKEKRLTVKKFLGENNDPVPINRYEIIKRFLQSEFKDFLKELKNVDTTNFTILLDFDIYRNTLDCQENFI